MMRMLTVGATLAMLLVPCLARANLCLSFRFGTFELEKLSIKKGGTSAAKGVYVDAFGQVAPVSANAVGNAAGTFATLWVSVANVRLGTSGVGISNYSPDEYYIPLGLAGGKLPVGTTTSNGVLVGYGQAVTFTVIRCKDAPPIP